MLTVCVCALIPEPGTHSNSLSTADLWTICGTVAVVRMKTDQSGFGIRPHHGQKPGSVDQTPANPEKKLDYGARPWWAKTFGLCRLNMI
jgi:catalase (peroxidase I)